MGIDRVDVGRCGFAGIYTGVGSGLFRNKPPELAVGFTSLIG